MTPLSSAPPSMRMKDWLVLTFLSSLWGSSFFFIEIIIRDIPTITLVSIRLILSAVILYLILLISGKNLRLDKSLVVAFFVMGLLNSILPYSLIAWGQHYVSSGMSATLIASTPLLTVIAAHYLTPDEKATANKIIGVVIGLLGVAIMLKDQFSVNDSDLLIGKIVMLIAASCYASGAIYSKKVSKYGMSPIETATGQMAAGAIFLTPFALIIDRPWLLPTPGLDTVLAMLGLVLLSSVLAYILFFKLMKTAGVTNLILVAFLIPVSSIILGVLVLNENFTLAHGLGMLFIGVSLTIIDGRALKFLRKAH